MKKQSFLLFKNAFKQAFRNKVQLIGLIVLVLLSSTIFSLMQTSLTRISSEYSTLVVKSNLHDFIIDLSNTAPVITSKTTTAAANVENDDLNINGIANVTGNEFIWDRIEGRTIQLANNGHTRILKILTYNKDARIDKLVISSGYQIGDTTNPDKKTPTSKQTVINKEFAAKNNLRIGDTIRVQADQLGSSLKVLGYDLNNPTYSTYNWLKIVGYGVSADFTTPIIDQTTPIPNKTREGLLYVDPSQFGLSKSKSFPDNNFIWSYDKVNEKITVTANSDREIYFVGKSTIIGSNNIALISQKLKSKYVNTTDFNTALVYKLGDSNYTFNSRTATLQATIVSFKSLLIALLLIVLIITGITVILITYKNIDNSRTQIGILKSLGYSNIKILITALAYPMVAALIGTILVFLPASALQIIIVNTFANYFNLNFGNFIFDGLGFVYCLILTFVFLSIIAWIISALTVIKKPIVLIKNESVTVNSRFSQIIKIKSINRGFLTRFRLSLFTSSIGKMAAVALTMFLGTTLMTTAIIGPKIMADNKKLSYTGMNYQSTVEYNIPTYNSPYTMYKTYNPNNKDNWTYTATVDSASGDKYWHPPRFDTTGPLNDTFVKELLANDINAEAYAPMSYSNTPGEAITNLGMNGLTYLNGKMLTKNFLNGLDSSDIKDANDLIEMIVRFAWPDALSMYEKVLKNNDRNDFYSDNTYNIIRKFYQDYRTTIAMNISATISKTNNVSTNPDDFDVAKFKVWAEKTIDVYNYVPDVGHSFVNDIDNLDFDTSDNLHRWHLTNEKQLLSYDATSLSKEDRNSWINKVGIWFAALFYNRLGQTVVQGTYTKSPYFIRQNIANAYSNPNTPFNVAFNVIPYDKNSDELGTYFIGTPDIKFKDDNYPIKVYGLQNKQQLGKPSMMQLYDSSGFALNPLLEQNNSDNSISIVINQTIAKQLSLKTNDEFMMSSNGNVMKFKDTTSKQFTAFDLQKINIDNIFNDENGKKNDNNVTLLKQNTSYSQVDALSDGAYKNLGVNATPMLKAVANGKVVNAHDNTMQRFKVVGIYNGYGQPNAYVAKNNADKILSFDQTKAFLFLLFKKEWQDKMTTAGVEFGKLKAITSYQEFIKQLNDDAIAKLNQVFEHQNPIFNFKFSNASNLPDITNSFSTSQMYGDYSAFGLTGGVDGDTTYQGYGAGSAINITPQVVQRQLLNQITALVNTLLSAFIIFSLIISFFIILLTSNLVIYENRKTIATMKTLGYSDVKITNIVIGMYLPVIAVMFLVGFPVGWIIVKFVLNYLAANTIWVLPLFFAWWLPLVVGFIVFAIYATTFIIDWYVMKQINPIKTLNEID